MRLQDKVAIVMDVIDNNTKGMVIELAADQIRINAVYPVAGGAPMLAELAGVEVAP
jgi:hypothetical protein